MKKISSGYYVFFFLYYVLGLFDKTFENKKLEDLTCYVHNYMEAHSQQIEKQGNNRLNVAYISV